jgi:type IV pilus assembly protein PilF
MMPLRNLLALLVVLAVVGSGCSRLTFVKPASKQIPFKETASPYSVSDSPATKQRLATQDRLALATQRLQSGDLASAEREATAVLKANPGSADAYTILAIVQDQKGNAERAGGYYKRAAELAPTQGPALNNYGAWLCGNGHEAESLVWFDRAIAAPGYASPASAHANAGGCALKVGQYERARRDLATAIALDPANPFALASMAESEFRQGRYFEARAFSERRLAAAPANAAVLQLAVNIEDKLGDTVAASRYSQRLRAEFPEAVTANPGQTTTP